MGLLGKLLGNLLKNTLEAWIINASDEELADGYEKRRLALLKEGGGDKTPEMERISGEMSRRLAKKWENDPHKSKDPNYRWTDANRWDKD